MSLLHIDVVVRELLKKDITKRDVMKEWDNIFEISSKNNEILSVVVNTLIYHISHDINDNYKLFEVLEGLCYDVGNSGCAKSDVIIFDIVMTNINYLLIPYCRGLLYSDDKKTGHKKKIFVEIINMFFTHEFRKKISFKRFSTDWDRITKLLGFVCFEAGNSKIIDYYIQAYSKIYTKSYEVSIDHIYSSVEGNNKETLIKSMGMCDSLAKEKLEGPFYVSCKKGLIELAKIIYDKLPKNISIEHAMIYAGLNGHIVILQGFEGKYDKSKVLTGVLGKIHEDLLMGYNRGGEGLEMAIEWLKQNDAVIDKDHLLKARREFDDPKYKHLLVGES